MDREASDKQLSFLKERLADANMNIAQAMFCLSAMTGLLREAKKIPLNRLMNKVGELGSQVSDMEGELNVVRQDVMKAETALDRPVGATPLLSANILLPEG